MTVEAAPGEVVVRPTERPPTLRQRFDALPRRRRTRIVRWAVTAVVIFHMVFVMTPLALVVLPKAEEPGDSDAILVLGPSTPARVRYAERLMQEHRARTLVISDYLLPWAPKIAACQEPRPYEVVCFYPQPGTTLGEGRALRTMAARRSWRSVQVVTFDPHVNRARFVIDQCFEGRVRVLSAPDDQADLSDVVHHMAGWVKAPLSLGC